LIFLREDQAGHAAHDTCQAEYNARLNIRLQPLRRGGRVTGSFVELPVLISSAYAQTAPAAAAGGDLSSFLTGQAPFFLVMIAAMYFFMIRPQMKKQKEHKAMIDALAKGDEIVTSGGLIGKVSKIGDGYLGLELAAGVEVQMQRSAVVQVLPKGTMK
jgi:preprotein translocase subunit YajC